MPIGIAPGVLGRIQGVVAAPDPRSGCLNVEVELEAWTYAADSAV